MLNVASFIRKFLKLFSVRNWNISLRYSSLPRSRFQGTRIIVVLLEIIPEITLSYNVMLISDLSFAHCGSKTVKQSMIPWPGTLQFPPFYLSSVS